MNIRTRQLITVAVLAVVTAASWSLVGTAPSLQPRAEPRAERTETQYDPKYHGLHSDDMRRHTWAYEGDWTHTAGNTVFDTQIAANQYGERNYYYKEHQYKPSAVGLPSYLDAYCRQASSGRSTAVAMKRKTRRACAGSAA